MAIATSPPEAVPLDDRGLLLGDGLFETLLWKEQSLVFGQAHATRMIRGAHVLGLPAPAHEAFVAAATAAVQKQGLATGLAWVRVTYTAGAGGRGLDRAPGLRPRLFAAAGSHRRPSSPARLHIASVRRNDASPASRLKTLAYLDNVLARREAHAAGADEAVMLNTRGQVACAAAANIAWVEDGVFWTPELDAGRLDGLMLSAVLEAAAGLRIETRQVATPARALERAEAIFLTSSLIGLRSAWLADERQAREHPIGDALRRAVTRFA